MKSPHSLNRSSILDTAERLFAERGFKSTSLRAITTQANVNLGAVNYHFASKDALILAVLSRRLQPLNEQCNALLNQFEAEQGDTPLAVEKIMEALFRPGLELIVKPSQGGRHFLRLLSFILSEPGKFLKPFIEEQFAEKHRRFHETLMQALPGLTAKEVYWRIHFSYGVFVHTLSHSHILEISSHGLCKLEETEIMLNRIVTFCTAGFKASAPSAQKITKNKK